MPTYRKLHTKILDSYDFAEMPDDFTRVFWMLLIVVVDSEGRAIDNPAWLRGHMFPLREDVQSAQIESSIAWLSNRSMVIRYQVDGRKYLYVPKFKNYQSGTEREAKSTLPAPLEQVVSSSGASQEQVETSSLPSVSVNASVNASAYVNESEPEKSNVFREYEKEIGVITPGIGEELKDLEKDYGEGLVIDAIHEASNSNKRSAKYIIGILRNWKREGRNPSQRNDKKPEPDHSPVEIILPGGQVVEARR